MNSRSEEKRTDYSYASSDQMIKKNVILEIRAGTGGEEAGIFW